MNQPICLDEILELYFQEAKEWMTRWAKMCPTFYVFPGIPDKHVGQYDLKYLPDEETLTKTTDRIIKCIAKLEAWAYFIVSDAWILAGGESAKRKLVQTDRPAAHEIQSEAIWAEVYTREYHLSKIAPYERLAGQAVFRGEEFSMGPDQDFAAQFSQLLVSLDEVIRLDYSLGR